MRVFELPQDYADALPVLHDVQRRAVDGTVPPLFVDYSNNRVLVGSITASGTGASLQVLNGDIACIGTAVGTAGNGYIFPDGTKQTTAGVSSTGTAAASNVTRVAQLTMSTSASGQFTGLATDTYYTIRLTLQQITATGYLRLRFNNDSALAYMYSNNVLRDDGTTSPTGSASIAQIELENTPNAGVAINDFHHFEINFISAQGAPARVSVFYQGHYSTSAGQTALSKWMSHGMGFYANGGGASMTSCQIFASAGTLTGDISLYKFA